MNVLQKRAPPWQNYARLRVPVKFERSNQCWRPRPRRTLLCRTQSNNHAMRIVFVTTEVSPWSKVGGLADVLAALPIALAARGLSVMTIAPRYTAYDGVPYTGTRVPLALPSSVTNASSSTPATSSSREAQEGSVADDTTNNSNLQNKVATATADGDIDINTPSSTPSTSRTATTSTTHAELYRTTIDGVDRVFVDHPLLQLTDIYGQQQPKNNDKQSLTYYESGELSELDIRYNILCQAALAAPVLLPDITGAQVPVVFVANDWPAALLPLRLHSLLHHHRQNSNNNSSSNSISSSISTSSTSSLEQEVEELQELLKQHLATAVTVFCIHNIAYQGILSSSIFRRLMLPQAALPALCTSNDWLETMIAVYTEKNQRCTTLQNTTTSTTTTIREDDDDEPKPSSREKIKIKLPPLPPLSSVLSDDNTLITPPTTTTTITAADIEPTALIEASSDNFSGIECCCEDGKLNLMRAALLTSHALTTVSPGYAQELMEDDGMAFGFRELISTRGIRGVMNGIDTDEWNPLTDPYLPPQYRYSQATAPQNKAALKAALQQQLGLKVDPNVPLVVFVGRLTQQKGVDALLAAAPAVLCGPEPPRPAPVAPRSTVAASSSSVGDLDLHLPPPPAFGVVTNSKDSSQGGSGQIHRNVEHGEVGEVGDDDGGNSSSSKEQSKKEERGRSTTQRPRRRSSSSTKTSSSGSTTTNTTKSSSTSSTRRSSSRSLSPKGSKGNAFPLLSKSTSTATAGVRVSNSRIPTQLDVTSSSSSSSSSSQPTSDSLHSHYHHQNNQQAQENIPPSSCQLALLGTGEKWMETALSGLQHMFPGQAIGLPNFSEHLAHNLLAAADFVIVPSRFEPCGLVAQCGVRYGAVPIVSAVGGLKDLVTSDIGYTVPPLAKEGLDSQDVQRWVGVLKLAVSEWGSEKYRGMQRRCMELDLGWNKPAGEWAELFEQLVEFGKID